MTKLGVEDRRTHEMSYDAAMEALDDANMSINDIDAVVLSNCETKKTGERQKLMPSIMSSMFQKKMPMVQVPAVCGSGGSALWAARQLPYNNILVVGAERLASNSTQNVTHEILMAADNIYEQTEGLVFPGQNALVAQQHMIKYGTTHDDLALVALKNHENAYSNPKASFFGKKVTLEKIKKAPMVASPLTLFDCSLSVNGAAACIISNDKSDIKMKASSLVTGRLPAYESEDMTSWTASKQAADEAYKSADISSQDLDFAEVHDAFTSVELINYEDLGFCKPGEGANLIRDEVTKIDGPFPVNPSGGLKAKGHPISATGLTQIYEVAKQMRKECKERQLSKINKALAQNIGGAGSTAVVHIFERIGG